MPDKHLEALVSRFMNDFHTVFFDDFDFTKLWLEGENIFSEVDPEDPHSNHIALGNFYKSYSKLHHYLYKGM